MITERHELNVSEYNQFRESASWSALEESMAKTGLENTHYLIALFDDEEPVAMARIVGDGAYIVVIADVIVVPEYQGKGYGRHVMEDIISHIKGNLKVGQRVFINLMSVAGKEEFYEKFGFAKRPYGEQGAGMTQWISNIDGEIQQMT